MAGFEPKPLALEITVLSAAGPQPITQNERTLWTLLYYAAHFSNN